MSQRYKIISKKQYDKPVSSLPKDVREFISTWKMSAIEFDIEDTETGNHVKFGPMPVTPEPKYLRNMEKLALESAPKALKLAK